VKGRKQKRREKEKKKSEKEPHNIPSSYEKKKQEPPPSAMPVWISQQQNYKEHRSINAHVRFKLPHLPS
jgi:hypothetical protein